VQFPETVRSLYTRSRHWLPAAFFVGGFVWDAVTLGRSIKPVDLFILLAYYAGAALILLALGREVKFRYSEYLNAVLQFFFGGMFSALFIFYFLSASGLPELCVVIALAGLLVGNEFLESRYSELTLSWAFFTLSGAMFFNFALAHRFRSINTFWFYLGTLLAITATLLLRKASTRQAALAPSIAVTVLLLLLHATNVIPPVPLVKKEMLIAHDIRRDARGYRMTIEPPGWRVWRSSSPVVHLRSGERIFCFTSVFVPNGIETTIRHRWSHYDARRGQWADLGTIAFPISGGRESGYRGYSIKSNVQEGEWRVVTESESGAAVGVLRFRVTKTNAAPGMKSIRR
jgi:hypothetical protein